MTDFEGVNPYEYQKAAVAMQKQHIAEQPHLKPQIEKANALPSVARTTGIETPKTAGGKAPGSAETKAGAGIAAFVGLRVAKEAVKTAAFLAKETVQTIATESIRGEGAPRAPKPVFRHLMQEPAPTEPRQDAGKLRTIRTKLQAA